MSNYEERLKLPITGDDSTEFFTDDGTLIAKGYVRIVIGKRGTYIEFTDKQMVWDDVCVPPDEIWRLHSKVAYYVEHRTMDKANVKIYEQKKTVAYADYKIGLFYISPFDLHTKDVGPHIIEPLKK